MGRRNDGQKPGDGGHDEGLRSQRRSRCGILKRLQAERPLLQDAHAVLMIQIMKSHGFPAFATCWRNPRHANCHARPTKTGMVAARILCVTAPTRCPVAHQWCSFPRQRPEACLDDPWHVICMIRAGKQPMAAASPVQDSSVSTMGPGTGEGAFTHPKRVEGAFFIGLLRSHPNETQTRSHRQRHGRDAHTRGAAEAGS